jgi:hypothetical protein
MSSRHFGDGALGVGVGVGVGIENQREIDPDSDTDPDDPIASQIELLRAHRGEIFPESISPKPST